MVKQELPVPNKGQIQFQDKTHEAFKKLQCVGSKEKSRENDSAAVGVQHPVSCVFKLEA